VLKPTPNIFWRNLVNRSFQRSPESTVSARLACSQSPLDFGDTLLKWIQIWRMRWQFFHPRPGCPDEANRPHAAMEGDLIRQDDIAQLQFGNEKMLDIQVPDLTIDGPLDHHRGAHPGQAQRADDRNVAARFGRFSDSRTLASRRTRINTRHGAMDPEFINKDQAPHIQAALLLLKGCSLNRVSFLREPSLFFE